VKETQDADFFKKFWANPCTWSTLCWLLGVDEVSGKTWQLVIAIHDEGAELILDVKLPS
jgi:hypothetical protein